MGASLLAKTSVLSAQFRRLINPFASKLAPTVPRQSRECARGRQNFNGTRPEFEFSVPLLSRTTSLGLYAQ